MNLLIICLIALAAGVLQGTTGFGAGIVMMMVFPTLFRLNQAAALAGAISVTLNIAMIVRYRRHIAIKKVIWPALLFMVASGSAIYLSTLVDQHLMKRIFGVFLVILGLYFLFFRKDEVKKLALWVSIIFVIVSGICDGLFGIGGPLMVIYFLAQTDTKEEYLGTIASLFCITGLYAAAMRVVNGILEVSHLPMIGMGIVGIMLGFFVATKIVDRLNAAMIKKVIYVVIVLSGIANIVMG